MSCDIQCYCPNCGRSFNRNQIEATNAALLEACKRALPYLADHVSMTLNEGPSDRMAYDLMEAAIKKAEEQWT